MPILVNGKKIDDKDIQMEFQRLKPYYEQTFADQTTEQREKQLLEWSTENIIERTLIQQHATDHPCQVDQKEIEAVFEQTSKQHTDLKETDIKKIKEQIKLQLKIERMLDEVCKDLPEPDESEIEKFYHDNKEHFTSPERIKVSHIVKHINWQSDEKTAQQLMQKAYSEMKAGTPFELLVSKYSDCPDRGGDLGYITVGQMVEEFDDVVFNLNPGQTSDVFRTRFGFHIAKLYDRKPPQLPALDQIREQIVADLKNKKREKTIEDFVDELKSKASIENT
ncbi:MAG: peptidylprolyl isomerase [Planctomycetota bacterium]|jgi:parvulin-like peptidyl-prolyl isomerase